MKIKLIKAAADDRGFLARVCKDAKVMYSEIIPESFEKQAKKFETQGIPENYDIYLIQQNNKKIGFVGIKRINKNIIYLVGLYLLLEYQRKGYGSKVINKLVSNKKKEDFEEIILLVHEDAYWAIDFYKKVNFEIETDNIKKIKEYAEGAMEDFTIPSTILMKRNVE